uniref:Uncharacterized protein n=1 Tax=Panagrolaimus davidi TaxID=227884 RepID=A0A914QJP9_9BILA
MFFKTKLFSNVILWPIYDIVTVKFDRKIEFSLDNRHQMNSICTFYLFNRRGDFKITKITAKINNSFMDLKYNRAEDSFNLYQIRRQFGIVKLYFEILANVEFKEVNYVEDTYELFFSSKRLKMLGKYEYEKINFVLPNYQYLKFECYFKKIANGFVEVHIVNPYKLKIEGKRGDFKYETTDSKNIDLQLSFVFDPSKINNENHESEAVESRPESALPDLPTKPYLNY